MLVQNVNVKASGVLTSEEFNLQEYVDNCRYFNSFEEFITVASLPTDIDTVVTLSYYQTLPAFAFHTNYAGNRFIRKSAGGAPTTAYNDGGNYVRLPDGSVWESVLPVHVDRFGACGGNAPIEFDSGPAFQRAVISVTRNGYSPSKILHMDGPVYRIDTKILWPSNVTFQGNQTAFISGSTDYLFESAYYEAGVLTSNWALTDTELLAKGIVTDSSFYNSAFIGVQRAFNLRGFTFGCNIGSDSKCVTFNSCGICVTADMSFYSKFQFFVRGDSSALPGQYATAFGHQCNLNRINVTYADRTYGTSLSELESTNRPGANMQLPDFTGSSFEGISGIGVLLKGTTYGVKLDGLYVENVATLVQKDSGAFLTHDMSLNNESWNFGVTKLLSIAGARNIKVGLSNQSGDYPSVEFVSVAGLENTGVVELKGKFGLTYPKFTLNVLDDVKLKFRYEFRGSEVVRAGNEFYVTVPNIGYEQFNYTFKAFGVGSSIVKSGVGSLQGLTSLGASNAYVTQETSGELILHFTGLDAGTYPWIDAADKVVSVWANL